MPSTLFAWNRLPNAVTTVSADDGAAPPGYSRTMAPSESLVYGRGYWITVAFATDWIVPGR